MLFWPCCSSQFQHSSAFSFITSSFWNDRQRQSFATHSTVHGFMMIAGCSSSELLTMRYLSTISLSLVRLFELCRRRFWCIRMSAFFRPFSTSITWYMCVSFLPKCLIFLTQNFLNVYMYYMFQFLFYWDVQPCNCIWIKP